MSIDSTRIKAMHTKTNHDTDFQTGNILSRGADIMLITIMHCFEHVIDQRNGIPILVVLV